jgi:hypothetical protein
MSDRDPLQRLHDEFVSGLASELDIEAGLSEALGPEPTAVVEYPSNFGPPPASDLQIDPPQIVLKVDAPRQPERWSNVKERKLHLARSLGRVRNFSSRPNTPPK